MPISIRAQKEFERLEPYYKEKAIASKSKEEFIDVSQSFLRSLRDPHLNLGPLDDNDYVSILLVPIYMPSCLKKF